MRTIDLDVTWSGYGPLTRSKMRDGFNDGTCRFRFDQTGVTRDATVTATVDGVVVPNSVLEEFTPEISHFKGKFKDKCLFRP